VISINPDGLVGSILAVEGMNDATIILNGPGGCRNYHSFLSGIYNPRPESRDSVDRSEYFFFGQHRVPCTYLDEEDYIHGSVEKVEDILPIVIEKRNAMIVIINSPGASLIGDDLDGIIKRGDHSDKALVIEEATLSTAASQGYDYAIKSMIDWLNPQEIKKEPNSINLLGISIYDNDWKHAKEDLQHLLNLMGFTVLSTPGAGCTVEELRNSAKAEFNVIVRPEYAIDTARLYEEKYNIPSIICNYGAPIGFEATKEWISTISAKTGADPSRAFEFVEKYQRKAVSLLREFQNHTTLPKGTTFGIRADSSIALALSKWLIDYLGMAPVAIDISPGEYVPHLNSLKMLLNNNGFSDVLLKSLNVERPDIVFADGHTAMMMERAGACHIGVNISPPSLERFNFIPRPIFGPQGSMYLLDEIINGF